MKRLIAFVFITGFVLMGLVTVSNTTSPISDTDIQTVQLANRLYNNEDYEGAVQLYQSLIDSGVRNVDVFYNLGNTYYQLGDNGRAILNLSRAQELNPRDAGIDHNLRVVQELADVTNPLEQATLFTQLQNITLTLDELGLIALMSAFVTVIVWQARRITKATQLKQATTIVLLASSIWLAGSVSMFGTRLYQEQSQPTAILVKAPTALNVPVGTIVQVLEHDDNRVRVIIPNTSDEGWISSDVIEMLSYGGA